MTKKSIKREWKVIDNWKNFKSSSFSTFENACKAALMYKIKYNKECMPLILHKNKKGYCFVNKAGKILPLDIEEWKDITIFDTIDLIKEMHIP